jgi:hypothetical protein
MMKNLDLFVSDELDGVDVRARHPHLWQHLQRCAACQEEHDNLLELLLMAENMDRLPDIPSLQMPRSPSAPQPWHLLFERLPGQPRPALLFLFSPAYLQKSLRPAARVGQRSAVGIWSDVLLLTYLDESEAGEIVAHLYARPDVTGADTCTMLVVAVGEPMPRAVTLTWGGQVWEATLGPDGDAELGPVPLTALEGPELYPEAFSLRLLP